MPKKLRELLFENRINWLKQNTKEIDNSHDTLAKHNKPEDIIDFFSSKSDPTPNKQHTQWIINKYKSKRNKDGSVTPGQFRQEDHRRIRRALQGFEKHKGSLANKDLNQYKSLNDLEDAIEPFAGKRAISKKALKAQQKEKGTRKVFENDNIRVLHLQTPAAGKLYSANTKWCTSHKHMFDVYSKDSPIYYIQDKHTGEKFQLHHNSRQLMNAEDRPVDPSKFVSKYQDLTKIPELGMHDNAQEYVISRHFLPEKEKHTALLNYITSGNDQDKMTLAHHIPESHRALSQDENPHIRRSVAISTKDMGIARILASDTNPTVRESIAKKHHDLAAQMKDDPSEEVRHSAASHSINAGVFYNDPSEKVRAQVATSANGEFVKKHMLNDPSQIVRSTIIDRHSGHSDIMNHFLNNGTPEDIDAIAHAQHRYMSTNIIPATLADRMSTQGKIYKYGILSDKHKEQTLKEYDGNQQITGEHATKFREDLLKHYPEKLDHILSKEENIKNLIDNQDKIPVGLLRKAADNYNNGKINKTDDHTHAELYRRLINNDKLNRQKHIDDFMKIGSLTQKVLHKGTDDSSSYVRTNIAPTIAKHTNNQKHIDKLLEVSQNSSKGDRWLHSELLQNPHVNSEIKRQLAKQYVAGATFGRKGWGNQKIYVLNHLDTPEEVKKMWDLRHHSSNYLIKNQKFVKAVHDHPYVDSDTKAQAAATIERYNTLNTARGYPTI